MHRMRMHCDICTRPEIKLACHSRCSWGTPACDLRVRAHRWKRGVLFSQGIAPMDNEDWFQQLPLFVAVSLGGGLLGAIFNAAHKAMFKARRSP